MHSQSPNGRFRKTWAFFAACGWVVWTSSAGLKEYQTYIHWFAAIGIFFLMWPRLLRATSRPVAYVFFTAAALVLSISLLATVSQQPQYEFIEAGKLTGILLVILPMLLARADTTRGLLAGARAATIVNAAVLLLGVAGLGQLVYQASVGRFDTILNPAGSMWRVGILVIVSSTLRLLLGKLSFWPVLTFCCSALLVILDGSRTGAICMLAGAIFVAWFIAREIFNGNTRVSRRLVTGSALLISALMVGLMFAPTIGSAGSIGFLDRGTQLVDSIAGKGGGGLEEADDSRFEMLGAAVEEIVNHPLLGTGMGTTRAQTATGPMVVHISYLQIWGDVGLAGFISYAALTLGTLVGPWARMRHIRRADLEDRIEFYNGIFVLFCFVITGFFHPVSTELTEWVMFLTGLAGVHISRWPRTLAQITPHGLRMLPVTTTSYERTFGSEAQMDRQPQKISLECLP